MDKVDGQVKEITGLSLEGLWIITKDRTRGWTLFKKLPGVKPNMMASN